MAKIAYTLSSYKLNVSAVVHYFNDYLKMFEELHTDYKYNTLGFHINKSLLCQGKKSLILN